jgi:hypothetical protein
MNTLVVVPQFHVTLRTALHDRQAALWAAWARNRGAILAHVTIEGSHAETFDKARRFIQGAAPEQWAIMEEDFLPELNMFERRWPRLVLPRYVVKGRNTGRDTLADHAGLWFVAGNYGSLAALGRLDFRPGGPYNDPGGLIPDLGTTRGDYRLVKHKERPSRGWPALYQGIGTHCFFSRHYGDRGDARLFMCEPFGYVTAGAVTWQASLTTEAYEKKYRRAGINV